MVYTLLKVKELFHYWKEKGVDPNELTDEERERFLVYPEGNGKD
ncbi:hypothetical protein ORM67_26130 [Bacillus cereus]|nr:hypothetical protein [Bacillus cereus]MDZ4654056.1 hypothetical protein [Bacillus cereus]